MSGFDLKNYDQVDSRLDKFWTKYPDGRVHSEMTWHADGKYIFRADLYTDRDDTRPAATGWAEEHVTQTGVNKTSALENCETSAIGRALANMNFQTKARPSQTEMGKADRQDGDQQPASQQRNGRQRQKTGPAPGDLRTTIAGIAKAKGTTYEVLAGLYYKGTERDLDHEQDPARIQQFIDAIHDGRVQVPADEPAEAAS